MSFQATEAVTLVSTSTTDIAQARIVAADATDGVQYPATGATPGVIGVTLEGWDVSESSETSVAIPIAFKGIVEVEASEAISVGSPVAAGDANGLAEVADTGDIAIGVCVAAAGGAGEFASVLLSPRGPVA